MNNGDEITAKNLTFLSSSLNSSDSEDLERMPLAPLAWKSKKYLSKQLSMCETRRDRAWERRRHLKELKGCIELGFGFKEEEGQKLTNTLPALDLYFAVNRQLSPSPVSTPQSGESSSSSAMGTRSSSFGSPKGDPDWKICSPGDDPKQVKTKLRHWAQAVACSVRQTY
ncbi:PRA1 family protein [Salix suchowensis]|nr:PRA1 family protein [Salix suchowensis]